MTTGPRLHVHTRGGVVVVPLTGDEKNDALLERLASKGGPVTRGDGTVAVSREDQAEADMRAALREGA